uniref:Uncharacterized protein n=1 Tax=Romanomermis culicivorax TaxID=13658 RepID=A0A915HLP3_ROMCU
MLGHEIAQLSHTGLLCLAITLAASIVAITPEGIALSVSAIGRALRAIGANVEGQERRDNALHNYLQFNDAVITFR